MGLERFEKPSLWKRLLFNSHIFSFPSLSTTLKLFPSSHCSMDFSQAFDSIISELICPARNTDAHFGSTYTWPREAILARASDLINF